MGTMRDFTVPPAPPPVSAPPAPRRMGGTAVLAAVAGWALFGLVLAWQEAVVGRASPPAEWMRVVARLLLAASAVSVVTAVVLAAFSFRQAAARNGLAIALGAAWVAALAFVWVQRW